MASLFIFNMGQRVFVVTEAFLYSSELKFHMMVTTVRLPDMYICPRTMISIA